MSKIKKIIDSIKEVFTVPQAKIIFTVIAIITFLVFVYLPVKLTPGNDIGFQLGLFSWKDYTLLFALSLLNSLLILMQIYIFIKRRKIRQGLTTVGVSGAGGLSAIVASVLSTASCSSCVASLFAFLGTGSIFFVLEYRWLFVSLALLIVLIGIFFASRSIQNECASCTVPKID